MPNGTDFPIEVKHTFPLDSKELICIEELYVSEKKHPSHWKKGNAANKGMPSILLSKFVT